MAAPRSHEDGKPQWGWIGRSEKQIDDGLYPF
ncbi:uncharacterized protein G2W53_004915 [Senna tora]|uniref:Uncharacterized protein n=1 Tax=Senna tora TaxID=362788 RepID=A0A834XE48_9FABA|nr:uncharacterized protein G2W53_004915 [Senna tora]